MIGFYVLGVFYLLVGFLSYRECVMKPCKTKNKDGDKSLRGGDYSRNLLLSCSFEQADFGECLSLEK